MARKYIVHMIVLGCVYVGFVGLTILNVVTSSHAVAGNVLVDGIIQEIFPSSLLIPLLILILGVVQSAYRRSIRVLTPWLAVVAASIPALLVFDNYAIECDVSKEIRRQIRFKLSPRELASLSTPESACPTFYSYKRESDGEWAVVSGAATFIRGTKVWFGTQ